VIAAEVMHYPEMCITGQRNVTVSLYTHASGGLTRNDFILAAKITEKWKERPDLPTTGQPSGSALYGSRRRG